MNRLFVLAGALALAVLVAGTTVQAEDKDKTPAIKDVMKQHVKGGARVKVTAAVKEKKWDEAATEVKKWVRLAEALGKNDPPRGDKDSWKKFTATYEKTIKTLATAIKEENSAKANSALGTLGASCAKCHNAHRVEE